MKSVFLSHSAQDAELAARLKTDLSRLGLHVRTIDTAQPGEHLPSRIAAEIEKSDAFLALLTPAYLRSRWGVRELEAGLIQRRASPVIPIIAAPLDEETFPPLFGDFAQIDLNADYEGALRQIVDSVQVPRREPKPATTHAWQRLAELLASLTLAAAGSAAASAVTRQLSDLLAPAAIVLSLTLLVALAYSLSRRKRLAPLQVVKGNVETAFVDALEESSLNPLRGGARHA